MKVSKKTEAEVLNVYDTWLHSYLNGDVTTYDSYFDDAFHFIGSTANEEFLNRTDTTQFFADTAAQLAGKCDLRNESRTIEQFGDLVFITHVFDAWFLNETDYSYYGRFRFSNTLRKNKEGWRFIYQHFSTPDSKTEAGETIGFDKVNEENQQLREAIQRRTTELELINRELQIEGAVDRIRAEAVAMKTSSDLLDIVVTMRNEFIKLGHEAHYFWHMMWLPKTYEKAMTSGDGSKIGFVMELPRHIHGNIPTLAKWEKSNQPTVVYPMDVDAAIDYVDKMIDLGDFKHIDPQAPTHDDIRHIGGLTFVMARTTHGEIGYSLPGVVTKPPKEDIAILVKFAGAFDLAHQRFLDLQKAEQQAKETLIELSLERIRSQVTAMQASTDLFDIVVTMRNEFISLGHEADYFWHMRWLSDSYEMSMTAEDGGRLGMVISVPKFVHEEIDSLYEWEKSDSPYFVLALTGKEAWDYIDNMNTHGKYQQIDPHAPSEEDILHLGGLTFVIARTTHGEIGFSIAGKVDNPPNKAIETLVRFAKVFDLAYKRFEDLQKAEEQARETQIELALEKVRSRTMAMQHSDEIGEVALILFEQLESLGGDLWGTGFAFCSEDSNTDEFWFVNKDGIMPYLKIPNTTDAAHQQMYQGWKDGLELFSIKKGGKELKAHYEYMLTVPSVQPIFQEMLDNGIDFPTWQKWHAAYFSQGYLLVITTAPYELEGIFKRFAKVFDQAYTRFLDLQKAEAQAREAKVEAAMERIRSRSMAMQKSEELNEVILEIHKKFKELDISMESRVAIVVVYDQDAKNFNQYIAAHDLSNIYISTPYFEHPVLDDYFEAKEVGGEFFSKSYSVEEKDSYFKTFFETSNLDDIEGIEDQKKWVFAQKFYTHSQAFQKNSCIGIADYSGIPLTGFEKDIIIRFSKVFDQAYTRFLDLQKAEAQARETQIQLALERVRARTMAMQHSDELIETSELLFQQINDLGITTWSCGYSLWYDNDSYFMGYNPMPNGKMGPPLKIPLTEDIFFKKIRKAKRSGEEFLVFESKGKSLVKTYEYMDTLPVVGEAMRAIVASGYELPKFQVTHCGFFSHGHLMFITHEHYPEAHEIFKRFTKEFEQTYTRFLDLQKAEAQARESEIELGLERLRAKAMAMQNSDELSDLVATLLNELTKLDFSLTFCIINIYNEPDQSNTVWAANPEEGKAPESYYMKFEDYPFHHAMMREWKAQTPKYVYVMEGEEKEIYDNYLYTETEFRRFPKKVKDANRALDRYVASFVFSPFGGLQTVGNTPLSDESLDILYRFGKVFDQTYTRFLDLQKAEAQTREAQIEAALERTRTQSMLMQHSDELDATSKVFHEQLQMLGINTEFSYVWLPDEEKDEHQFWVAWNSEKKGSKVIKSKAIVYPLDKSEPYTASCFKDWASGISVHTHHIKPAEVKTFFTAWEELLKDAKNLNPNYFSNGLYYAEAFMKYGCFGINIKHQISDEEKQILERFSVEFERTYTRFLDLQKAEAQAQEAQIEAALERVRSRSLAMHKTDELQEVVQVVAEELKNTGVILDTGGAVICTYFEDSKDVIHWTATEDASHPSVPYKLPYFEDELFDEAWMSKDRGDDYFAKEFSFEVKNAFFSHAFEHSDYRQLPEEYKKVILESESHGIAWAWSKNSAIMIPNIQGNLPSEEEKEILKRFAKVFEQAFIRFMDLQKAETQARTAQINLAVERVRAKALAMHKSEEIMEVVAKLKEEVMALDIPNVIAATIFLNEGGDNVRMWDLSTLEKDNDGYQIPFDITFKLKQKDPNLYVKRVWENPEDYFLEKQEAKDFKRIIAWLHENDKAQVAIEVEEFIEATQLKCLHHAVKKLNNGKLVIDVLDPPSAEMETILTKMGAAFDLAYKRFEDLQKAEKQTREAQIEMALEKVRSRTMAMQHSEELPEAANVLFTEVQNLGIPAWSCGYNILSEDKKSSTCIMSSEGELQSPFILPLTKHESLKPWHNAILNKDAFFVYEQGGSDLVAHYDYMQSLPDLKDTFQQLKEAEIPLPTFQVNHLAKFTNGFLLFITYERVPKAHDIFQRFAKVFEQTYTRFLDLKRAEAQARESQIQLSLERVRARAMAMHDSEELDEVLTVLCEQFDVLGIIPMSTHMTVLDLENNTFTFRETGKFGNRSFGEQTVALDAMDNWEETIENWKADKATAINKLHFPKEQLPEVWEVFHKSFASMPEESRITPDDYPDGIYHTAGKHPFGYIGMNQTQPATKEEEQIVIKFAKEFGSAYQRFLDLQKAEEQAREAQIEASLEKVRSVALTLQKSEDMLGIAQALYEQLLALGFNDIRNAIIDIHNDETETFVDYDYSHDMSSAITEFSYYGDPVIEQQIKKTQSANDAFFEIELKGEQLKELIETRIRNGEQDDPRLHEVDHLTYNLYSFGNGAIGISNFGVLNDEQKTVLKRFRNVFTFAYKRYTDLAKAEAQAREAKIEASLEKVRSVALSMVESTDLAHIVKALYEQLVELGFSDIRNALIDVNNEDEKTFLDYDYSDEMGGTVTLMSYDDDPTLEEQLRVIASTTDGYSEMVLEGQQLKDLIEMRRKNGEADDPRLLKTDSVAYILYAFGNGAVGISNFGMLSKDQKSILDRFRNVFTFAYQRFQDLQVREEQSAKLLDEKIRLEKTLSDLQAAQKQLIQSEKMASLGELTAGIAHEIQNPLNFVNNFSEVSNELIEEIDEELAKGDMEEVKALLLDIKQNLEKINHHGKRADGIVKGMLQHSRSSGVTKEPTELNTLCEEYLRLSYHGLRAKDKSFNATLETNFDDSVGKVPIIPQDIGRVILNLLTNAFYAVSEKKKQDINGYQPTVGLETRHKKDSVQVVVTDNGNGIPQQVVDKIFQPFFTTKPTGQGTGLGLSMSYDIITKAHNGRLEVTTKETKGTEFTITLPKT